MSNAADNDDRDEPNHADPEADQEGVIQFAYSLNEPDGSLLDAALFAQLRAWRTILLRLGLVGQDAARYQGLGFGNLSVRDPDRPGEFVITASQTGGVDELQQEDLTRIVHCNLERFWVDAIGTQPPSSETLTHAMIYAADARIQWVIHSHSPDIWLEAETLALPATAETVRYGTPEMVSATAGLLATHHSRPLVFVTQGHRDGVFACGPTARDTGGLLVSYLARALSRGTATE